MALFAGGARETRRKLPDHDGGWRNCPRTRHVVLKRGEYDKPGDKVEPGVPAVLLSPPADAPRSRLGFAKWLVHLRTRSPHAWR